MKRALMGLFTLSLVISSMGCISGGNDDIEWNIEIYGDISASTTLTYDDINELPQTSIDKKVLNGSENYSGVGLNEVISIASPGASIDTVNCIADDGYILTFTLNDFESGLLITRKEGELLGGGSGPVMLGFNIGCACNWMKRVQKIEFFSREDSLGVIGDVANPVHLTISDIRDFTGKENDFTVEELFKKTAYYQQAQTFTIYTPDSEYNYLIGHMADAIVTYKEGSFNVAIDGMIYEEVISLDCVWTP